MTRARGFAWVLTCVFLLPLFATLSQADPFTDITKESMTGDKGRGKGIAWADVDGDGLLDMYVSNKGGENRLYLNRGDGTFADVTAEAGAADAGFCMGSVFGDVNNDGKPDLYLAKGGRYEIEANRLLINASTPGKPKFVDVTEAAGVGCREFTYGAAMGDYNRDGKLDIYCANYGVGAKNVLYRNDSRGEEVTFTDVSDTAGVGDRSWSWSASFSDVNGDGWPDIYVSNGRYPAGEGNRLFVNNGDGTFRDATEDSGTGDANWSLGAAFGDVDNDGDLDMYVSNYVGSNTLYLNDGAGRFKDIAKDSGVGSEGWGKGPTFGDIDHDGDLDLYEGDCKFSNQLYRNKGDGTFTDVVNRYPFMMLETVRSKGAAFGDFDNDGDLDLYVINWEMANRLFRNEQNDNGWIKVECSGTSYAKASPGFKTSRDAIGAKVYLFAAGTRNLLGYREVISSNGFCSQPPREVHFGVDPAGSYDVEVRFPSGKSVVKAGLAPGSTYLIAESE
ncbi:MAG: hypothetical protein GTN70_10560 [Deltaproteobacteria bacterium]|nr:hypothetical protein [Deltaproteobacteria bacterium]NIS78132.1 hypothetical protein [Deltaproteobacteria bacterium]